jgi:hypothetical protein
MKGSPTTWMRNIALASSQVTPLTLHPRDHTIATRGSSLQTGLGFLVATISERGAARR